MHSLSGGNAGRAGTVETVPGPVLGATHVSHDMESIFGRSDSFPEAHPSTVSPAITPIISRSSPRRFGRGWALAAVAIVGVLGISIVLAQRDKPQLSPKPIAEPVPSLTVQAPRVTPGPTSVQAATAPTVPTRAASEPATRNSAAVKSRPKTKPAADSPKRKSTQRLAAKSAPTAHRPSDSPSANPRASSPCDGMGGLDLARCMRPQVLDADRQLRTAYRDAVRSGVDRRTLAGYRRQWSKLRKQANSDPRSVTTGYRQMAEELDASRTARRPGEL